MVEGVLANLIVARTAKGESRSDIVKMVCQRTGMSWPEAEALVVETCASHEQEIARRRLPLWLTISLVVLAAGLVMLWLTGSHAADLYRQFHIRQTTFSAAAVLWRLILETPLLWQQGILGAALVLGGALGLRQSLSGI